MEIIKYEDKYLNDVRDLLLELEEYIVSIDEDNLDQVHEEYWEKMALFDLEEVNNNDGICYIAVDNNKAIGVIMGVIIKRDLYDYLDYKCPKAGDIIELVVSKEYRGTGIGNLLMDKMEEYFKSKDCEYIHIDVFAYNKNALKFYNNKGYHSRMYNVIKKLD